MGESNKAYELSIDDGKVRIVIKIEDIKVDVINSTNEFITPSDDEIYLFLSFSDLEINSTNQS